jgi:hypothetical protein
MNSQTDLAVCRKVGEHYEASVGRYGGSVFPDEVGPLLDISNEVRKGNISKEL